MTERPLIAAQTALHQLRQRLTEKRGTPPTIDEFYPVDVAELIRLQGWEAKVVQAAGLARDYFSKDLEAQANFKTKTILVTRNEKSPGRERFSLAHELGHVLLGHDSCGSQVLERAAEAQRPPAAREIRRPQRRALREREADRFATELLLPSKAVKKKFQEQMGSPPVSRSDTRGKALIVDAGIQSRDVITAQRLAEIISVHSSEGRPSLMAFFGVSRGAMAIRLLELGLVT